MHRSATSAKLPVILNPGSGSGARESELAAQFSEAGITPAITLGGADLRGAVRRALRERPAIIVAAGGDGTLNAVANELRGTETALGVLPLGTLNHFARDLGIPLDPPAAMRIIAAGRRTAVDVGEINGTCFINNASLGLYPDIVRERKRQQRRLGRSKRTAMLWATLAALDRAALLSLRLELEDDKRDCLAPFVFVGNNEYRMEGFEIGTRARLDGGTLSVYTTQRCTTVGLFTLALRALFGRLNQADDFIALRAHRLRVETRHPRLLVATDGELATMHTPLEFRIRPRALNVIVP